MAEEDPHVIIKFRRGTADEWANSSPQPIGEILKLGEPGFEKDTGKLKIGDGTKGWNELPYITNSIVLEDFDKLIHQVLVAGSGIDFNFDDDNNKLTINTLSSANPFDQDLNTTDNTEFNDITTNNRLYFKEGQYIDTSSGANTKGLYTFRLSDGTPILELEDFTKLYYNLKFPDDTSQNTAALPLLNNNYIICKTGDSLASKYSAAKNLTPGGNALSATNRATLIVMPGNYSLSEELVVDTEFVDILGLGSIKLDRGCVTSVTLLNNTINITANNVRVKGIGVGSQAFKIGTNLMNQIIEDCVGGNNSFNANIVAGSFINCVAANNSYGYQQNASGIFTNCLGGNFSFGSSNTMSPGNIFGIASGQFNNCVGGNNSFAGGFSTAATGIFQHCIAGSGSFGATGLPSVHTGKFIYCRLSSGTFPSLAVGGKIRLCIDGNYNIVNNG